MFSQVQQWVRTLLHQSDRRLAAHRRHPSASDLNAQICAIQTLETRRLLSGESVGTPSLSISKGVVATSSSQSQFDAPVGPADVTFAYAGSDHLPFSGTIDSDSIRTGTSPTPLDANLINGHSGDFVRMAVLIENQSPTASAFDVTFRDTLAAGTSYIPGSLRIVTGNGIELSYLELDATTDGSSLFGTGILLDDPGSSTGSYAATDQCGALDGNSVAGNNIAIAFYDVSLINTPGNNALLSSDASIVHYAGTEKGSNLSVSESDGVSIRLERIDLEITKSVSNTSPLVGDVITWTINVTNNAANATSAATGIVIHDTVPPGQSIVTGSAVFPAGGSFDASTGHWNVGQAIAVGETVQLSFETIVGQSVDSVTSLIDLQLSGSVSRKVATDGQSVDYQITVTNAPKGATVGATDIRIADLLPGNLILVSSSTSAGSFDAGAGIWDLAGVTLLPGQSETISLTTTVAGGAGGFSIQLTPQVVSTSQPDIDSVPGNLPSNEDDDFEASIFVTAAPTGSRPISGRVFLDTNNNGMDDGEDGVPTVVVTAFDNTGVAVGTTTTDGTGNYSIASVTTGAVRLEFTQLPGSHSVTTSATGTTVSSVAFIDADTAPVIANLAVYQPKTAVQYVTTCFVYSGQSTLDPTVEPAVVVFNADGSIKRSIASIAQVGATNGVATHAFSGDTFVAAFHKRHSDIGPSGNGAIYRISPDGTVNTFIRLDDFLGTDSAGPYSHTSTDWFTDAAAFGQVGRVALGDIDISEDGRFLYTINLASRELIQIEIGSNTSGLPIDYLPSDTRTVQRFAILGDDPIAPTNGGIPLQNLGADPGGNIRPFGLTVKNGLVYAGMVYTAETTFDDSQLAAHVYAFNPQTASFANTAAASFGLDSRTLGGGWHAWTDNWADLPKFYEATGDFFTVGHNQPWLTDIEFDHNGDMILGFRDRTGDQVGHMVGDPTGADSDNNGSPDRFYHDTKGEILRLRRSSSNTWEVEPGHVNGDGTEYYSGDEASFDPLASTLHPESAQGGLTIVPGFTEVVTTAIDPQSFWSGGTIWLENATGVQTGALDIYSGSEAPDLINFGKNNGLGDLEHYNDLPIEIGNRVWHDTNANGIQDAGEPALNNVTVELFDVSNADSPVLVGSTTTDANGQYAFNSSNVVYSTAGPATGIRPLTDYELRIAPGEFQAGGSLQFFRPTQADREPVLVARTTQVVTGTAVFDSNGDATADTARNQRFDVLTAAGLNASGARVIVTNATGGFGRVDTDQTIVFEFADGSTTGTFEYTIVDDRIDNDAQGIDQNNDGIVDQAVIAYRSGASGHSDHSLDFGFIQSHVDLELSKNVDRQLAAIGDVVTFFLTVTNNSSVATIPASGVAVADSIPAGLSFIAGSAIASQGTFDGALWSLPDALIPGVSATLSYQVSVDSGTAGTILRNLAQVVTHNEPDIDSTAGNNDGDQSEDDEDEAVVFIGTLTSSVVTNRAQVIAVTEPDFDSTPANDDHNQSEDDEAAVTFTINTTAAVFDFGDLPDNYLTLSASGGPSHQRDGVTFLGANIDNETDGQPTATAQGDGSDDDGVRFLTPIFPNQTATIEITSSTNGFLNAWIDFDADGTLDELNITSVDGTTLTTPTQASDLALSPGKHTVTLLAPSTVSSANAARFRFSSNPMAAHRSTGGPWPNGEVEDYMLRQIGDQIWLDLNNNGIFDAATETGIPNVTVSLTSDFDEDGSNETFSTTTDAGGTYNFPGLLEGNYTVTVDPPGTLEATFDPDGGGDNSAAVVINTGDLSKLDIDFGYGGSGLIGNTVWLDTNANGIVDSGEPGIPGIDVTLTGDINGDTLIDITRTVTTDSAGQYEFGNLLPGEYTVTVNPPSGTTPTFDADGIGTPHTSSTTLTSGSVIQSENFGYQSVGVATSVDLSITKFNQNSQRLAAVGSQVVYSVVVSNSGPDAAVNAIVTDTLPAMFHTVTWTATGSPGTSFTATGSGSLAENISIPAGGSITYTVTGQLEDSFSGTITNTATVSTTQTDSDLTNNSSTDVTRVTPLTLTPENLPQPGEPFQLGARGMSHVALVPFVVGTRLGTGTVNGTTVDIADPQVFMVGFVCVDDRIIGVYDIPSQLNGQTLYFQAYQSAPDVRLSNVIEAKVGGPRPLITQTGDGVTVTEGAKTDSFGLVLSEQPTSNVVVHVQNLNPARVKIEHRSVTFTPTNWFEPQFLNVSAVDDSFVNGDAKVNVRISVENSSAPEFISNFVQTVRVDVFDDDHLPSPVLSNASLTTSNQQPSISWSAVSGADSYDVWISHSADIGTPIVNNSVVGTSFTPATPLDIGRMAVWVRARSSQGETSQWSVAGRIDIRTAPTLTRMASGSLLRPTISWTAVAGATHYELWVNNRTTGISQVIHKKNLSATSFTPQSDLSIGDHVVWVRAINRYGRTSSWSVAESFAVGPGLLGPKGPSFSQQPLFQWTQPPGATAFEIYLRVGTTVIRETGLTSNTWIPQTSLPEGTHRWWVRAFAANGRPGKWSEPADFTTGGRPAVLSPVNSSSTSTLPLFEWTTVENASTYSLYVGMIGSSGAVIHQQGLTSSVYSHSTSLAVGTYRVWVRAISKDGQLSPWSTPVTFSVAQDLTTPNTIPDEELLNQQLIVEKLASLRNAHLNVTTDQPSNRVDTDDAPGTTRSTSSDARPVTQVVSKRKKKNSTPDIHSGVHSVSRLAAIDAFMSETTDRHWI